MPPRRTDNDEELICRIDMLLEELRLNTEDLNELARQAKERARKMRHVNRVLVGRLQKRAGKER